MSGARLAPETREMIIKVFTEQLQAAHKGAGWELWLFGSRANASSRGGDIDLLLELEVDLKNPLSLARDLKVGLLYAIGEQRVDVMIKTPATPRSAIHDIAKAEGVLLCQQKPSQKKNTSSKL